MKGRLGAFYINGKQVGWFLDWNLKVNLSESIDGDSKVHKPQSWRLTADSHWLIEETAPRVQVKLCAGKDNYWEGTGNITSKLTDLMDTLVHEEIEIIGRGELKGG